MDARQRMHTAITVAKMYYIDGISQDEIAQKTDMSRSNISRILKKCISDGVVEIIVHDNISERSSLAHSICSHFQFKDVIIVPYGNSADRQNRLVGERLALYLDKILSDNMLLGVSRGYCCYYAARNLKNPHNYEVNVIQLLGAASSVSTSYDSERLVHLFASKLNGTGYLLSAPLMVHSKKTKQELLMNSLLYNTVRQYKNVDVAIFEIHKPDLYTNDLSKQEWLTKADMLQLSEVKAESCLCGYYFDINGRSCNVGINDRIIAIDRQNIKNIQWSIGIITGKNSLNTAISAINSKMINVLVIDESLALNLKKYIDEGRI